ncbi:MAG: N-acetylmuramoyl-L-alanine amidase [Micrococcaceae bacterium]
MPNLALGLLAPAVSLTLVAGLGLPAVVSASPPTAPTTVPATTVGDTEAVAPTGQDEESITIGEIDPDALPLEAQPEPEALPQAQRQAESLEPSPSAEEAIESTDEDAGAEDTDASETPLPATSDETSAEALDEPTEETSAEEPSGTVAAPPIDDRDATEQELAETALPDEQEQLAALTTPTETIDFIAAGLTWNASTTENVVEASVRVREGGEWSDWNELEIHPIDRESGVTVTKQGTEPLLTNGADAIQARVLTESGYVPGGLEVTVIDPGKSPTDGQLDPASAALEEEPTEADLTSSSGPSSTTSSAPVRLASSITPAASEPTTAVQTASTASNVLKPAIVTRNQWGANELWAVDSAQSPKLDAMYIHHTAGTNNYTAAQAYQQIRAIYSYHAQTLDWGDIGYQFLVDRFGTIYEGRRGALTSLPIGAQAGGFNTNTIGISAMGNFDVAQPPVVMVEAMQKVLAWQGYRHGLKANSNTQLTSRATPGSSAKYSSGTKVTVPVILGHRDTNSTACPGRYLYPKLSSMRTTVAQRIANAEKEHGPGDAIYEQMWLRSSQGVKNGTNSGASTLGWIGRGEIVTQIRTSGSWSQVQTPIGEGWLPTAQLSTSRVTLGAVMETRYTKRSTAMRVGSNSKFAFRATVPDQARVEVLSRSGAWSYVSTDASTGWIATSHLHVARWASTTVLAKRSPSSSAASIGRIGRAEAVGVRRTSGWWSEVLTPIGRGWMPTSQVTATKVSPGSVIANQTTNRRTTLKVGAHSSFGDRAVLANGAKIRVHARVPYWSYVTTSVGTGWVATSHLK